MTDDQTGKRRSPRLPGSRRARTTAGAVGLSLALLGAGIAASTGVFSGGSTHTAAVAAAENDAPPATPPVVTPVNSVTNLTPYTWKGDSDVVNGAVPPRTVAPGQTVWWNGSPNSFNHDPLITDYYFKDGNGGQHQVHLVRTRSDFQAYSWDVGTDGAWHDSTQYFQMYPDSSWHTTAIWKSPAVITIDGATDPASAAAAVNYLLPGAVGVQWKPKPGATPSFAWGPSTRATSMIYNYSSEPVTVAKGQETTKGQSTSIGEELSYSSSVDIDGIIAKSAASFTSDQEWGSSDSVDVDVDTEVEPGNVGWINKRASVASLTGDLSFIHGQMSVFIDNVTISKGDIINPAGGVPVGMDFTPYQQPATPAGP